MRFNTEPNDYVRMKMMGYWEEPNDNDCEVCADAGYDECQCEYVDGYDPLDDPNFSLTDDGDGLTKEEAQEIAREIYEDRDTRCVYCGTEELYLNDMCIECLAIYMKGGE